VYIPTRVPPSGKTVVYTHQGASITENSGIYPPECLPNGENSRVYTHQGASLTENSGVYTHQGASLTVNDGTYPPGCLPNITRFTVGLGKAPLVPHPFHCWARKDGSLPFPFHCWARKGSLPTTRFTVGLRMKAFHHPFHCWAKKGTGGIPTYPPWYSGGYTTLYIPLFQVLFTQCSEPRADHGAHYGPSVCTTVLTVLHV